MRPMHGKLIASGRPNIDDARGIVVDRVRRTSQTNAARAATMREIWMARIRKLTGLAIAAAIVPFAMMTGGLFAQDGRAKSAGRTTMLVVQYPGVKKRYVAGY